MEVEGDSNDDNTPGDPDLHSITIMMEDGSTMATPEYLSNMLSLNFEKSQWLSDHQDISDGIYSFIAKNQFSEEAKAFAKEAIDAFMNGGEVDFDNEIVYTSNVPECLKNIIKKLLNDKAHLDLGDMPDFVKQELNLSGYILEIFNYSDKYNLIFDDKNNLVNHMGQRLNAKTDPKRDENDSTIINFTITLDSDYVSNATDLSVARTIIHETLHAYFSYIYQDEMFSDLSNSLRTLLSANNYDPNTAQHILMTQQFINAISNSLESWDNSSLANDEYYNYLSWSGAMLNTSAFNDLDANTQQAIKDANIAEGSALSPATGQAQGTNNCN